LPAAPVKLAGVSESPKKVADPLLPVDANVIESPEAFVVILILVPATNVKVSVAESATTFVCPDTAIVLNASVTVPDEPPISTIESEPSFFLMNILPSYVLMATSPSSKSEVEGVLPETEDRFSLIVCAMWLLQYYAYIRERELILECAAV